MKKALCIAMIAIAAMITAVPQDVSAAEGDVFSAGGLNYVILDNEYHVSVGDGTRNDANGLADRSITNVTIPEEILHGLYVYTVTSISYGAFRGSSVTSVSMADSVVSVGGHAFQGCTELTEVAFGSSLETIGRYAFQGTGLTELRFMDAFREVGERSFENCTGLGGVYFGRGISRINDYAFKGCPNLIYILVPSSVLPFFGVGSLDLGTWDNHVTCRIDFIVEQIDFIPGAYTSAPLFDASWVYLTLTSRTSLPDGERGGRISSGGTYLLGDTVRTLAMAADGYVFLQWEDDPDEPAIRSVDMYTSREFTAVFGKTFSDGTYNYVILGENAAGIGTGGEYGNALAAPVKNVKIPETVEYEGVTYNITKIMRNAFYGVQLDGTLEMPDGITEIGDGAFYGCSGISGKVVLPSSLESVGEYAFCGCSGITSLEFRGMPSMENWSFALGTEDMRSSCTVVSELPDNFLNHYKTGFTSFSYNGTAPVRSVYVHAGDNGSVSGTGRFFEGTTATITAAADEGFAFERWSDGNTDAVRNVLVASDVSYTAEFREAEFRPAAGTGSNTGIAYIAAVLAVILAVPAVSLIITRVYR